MWVALHPRPTLLNQRDNNLLKEEKKKRWWAGGEGMGSSSAPGAQRRTVSYSAIECCLLLVGSGTTWGGKLHPCRAKHCCVREKKMKYPPCIGGIIVVFIMGQSAVCFCMVTYNPHCFTKGWIQQPLVPQRAHKNVRL